MANLAKALKDEISRISRKEAKTAALPNHTAGTRFRKDIADLKKRVAMLEQTNRKLLGELTKAKAGQQTEAAPEDASAKTGMPAVTGRGIKALRKRLKVSQAELAKAVGVTPQAVYLWEKRPGKLRLRDATRTALAEVQSKTPGEIREALAAKA